MRKTLALLGVFWLAWVLACGGAKDATAPASESPKAVEIKVSAVELATAYEDNEVAADAKYKGKRLSVTGKVFDVGEILGQKSVTLEGKSLSLTTIQCPVPDSNKDALLKLKKGGTVTVEGTCDGKSLAVVTLKDCLVK
jgi:hypothetical protein